MPDQAVTGSTALASASRWSLLLSAGVVRKHRSGCSGNTADAGSSAKKSLLHGVARFRVGTAGTGPFFGRRASHCHQAMAENMDLSPLTRTTEIYTFAREGVWNL